MRLSLTSRALHVLTRRAARWLSASGLGLSIATGATVLAPSTGAAAPATLASVEGRKPAAQREAKLDSRKPAARRQPATTRSKRPASTSSRKRTTRRAGDVLRRKPVTRPPRLLAARSNEPEIGEVPTVVLPDLSTLLGGPVAGPADSATGFAGASLASSSGAFTEIGRSASALLDRMISRARSQLGTRYVLGGEQPGASLDCSSFARYAMEALGIALPRTAAQQARVGQAVPRDRKALRPGDLLTFGTRRTVDHVGIYLGEGRFIHASVKSGRVIETTIDRNGKLFRKWTGARRLIASSDSVGTVGS